MAGAKAFVTDTELELLKALWSDEPLTARELAERMYPEEGAPAIGTVQKLIQRLEEKSLLKRDRRETVHRFSALVTREAVAGMQLKEFADKLSGGSLAPFLTHLVQAERLSKKDKQALRRLLGEQ